MSDLKYEWPYIKFLTIEDKKNYQSDLPNNMDTLEVRQLVPTPLWDTQLHKNKGYLYSTNAEVQESRKKALTAGVWISLWALTVGYGTWSLTNFYNMNAIRNYKYFKSELWPEYLRLRLGPTLMIGWSVFYVVSGIPFSSYPFPDTVSRAILAYTQE